MPRQELSKPGSSYQQRPGLGMGSGRPALLRAECPEGQSPETSQGAPPVHQSISPAPECRSLLWPCQREKISKFSSPKQLMCVCMLSRFSHVQLFAALWTVALQAPLSMGFSRQEYWSALPCPPPGDLPDPGIKPSPVSSALQEDSFTTEQPGKPKTTIILN